MSPMIEVFQPLQGDLLISPAVRANLNNGMRVEGVFGYPCLLYLLALKDDEWRRDVTVVIDAFDDGNPFAIPELNGESFLFMSRDDDLSVVNKFLHNALLIHVIDILIRDVVT